MRDAETSCRSVFQDIARFRGQLFDRLIAPYGLTISQATVLLHLLSEDGLTQSDLARRMDVGTVTIGGLVDRLEARGLVARHPDARDRRAKRVYLTSDAHPLETVMAACSCEVNSLAFKGLSAKQVDALMDILKTVRQNLVETLQETTELLAD